MNCSNRVEPHHRKLVSKIPPEHREAYLCEFVADYIQYHGAVGLLSRFPQLSPHYEDPPLGMQPPEAVAGYQSLAEATAAESEQRAQGERLHALANPGTAAEPPRQVG